LKGTPGVPKIDLGQINEIVAATIREERGGSHN
jgi:hypothetical protein